MPVLIFSNSVRLLKMVSEFISTTCTLLRRDIGPVREAHIPVSGFDSQIFTGEANENERMRMVDNFQDPELDHFVMLISTQAGGVGLNLTAANKVVIFDPDWSETHLISQVQRDRLTGKTLQMTFRRWIERSG
jgi:SNF2 family DNA or RNA helicase